MEGTEIKPVIESLIFVSEEPISLDLMTMVFEEVGLKKKEIKAAIDEITNDYNLNPDRGMQLVEVAGGYQFRTKPALATWIQKLNIPKPIRLSQPAMETMAIVAYRQPILRSEIEHIRGVDSGGVLKTLLEKGLIRIIGKSDEVGHPLVYGTTKAFLEMFSLNDLRELPTLKEIDNLSVQEKVGQLGMAGNGEVPDGEEVLTSVGDVIDEYKEGVEAYVPDPGAAEEDSESIQDLESSIKNLRNLEKAIFPKPKEELQAVPKEGEEGETEDEGTSSQDTSQVN